MCGIAGKVYADPSRRVNEETVRTMCRRLVHRGPDDEGYFNGGQVGLGMRRLQVIDIAGGGQPISNEDGNLWIVFNGEIYNYRALRCQLEAQGHVFSTQSDTETILHLYEQEGEKCVEKLRGMFAFALWDCRRGSLFVARDRLGKKPLFYALDNKGLSFASELGALLGDKQVTRQIDPVAVDEFLSYLFVPHPRTIYQGIRKLAPGSWARYQDGQWETKRYWTVRYDQPQEDMDEQEALERLDELLKEAVELRLVADVPVGSFLSGGLDSSLVTALMQQLSKGPVQTFAIGFEESSFDELGYARQVATALGTTHREHVVSYQVEGLLPKLLEHFGEPFADSSAIPMYHLAKVARQEVTVALSGDGGDEVFGGYRRYQAGLAANAYNRWPAFLRGAVEWVGRRLGEPAVYLGSSRRKQFKRYLEFAANLREAPHSSWAFFLPKQKKGRFTRKNLPIY